jgi:hypothetical protein
MKAIIVVVLATIFALLFPLISHSEPNYVIRETLPVALAQEIEVKQEPTFDSQIRLFALKYGQDETLARSIIQCESSAKHDATGLNFEASSTIAWSKDIGFWQINDYYHKAEALKKGFDITDRWQNLEYGFILLKQRGTNPWRASKHCWEKTIDTTITKL